MKSTPPPLRVGTPCPKQWDDMSGDAKRRFCEHCQLHVHNLSAMSRGERDRFVAESRSQACIAYELRPDGTMVTPSFWRSVFAPFRRVQLAVVTILATLLPFLLSACTSRRTLGKMACPGHTPSKSGSIQHSRHVTVGIPVSPEASHVKESKPARGSAAGE